MYCKDGCINGLASVAVSVATDHRQLQEVASVTENDEFKKNTTPYLDNGCFEFCKKGNKHDFLQIWT